ncbi:MAG: NAD-dependent epimerase/dehydratase family protein [Salinivirgaceae bacterium]
MAKQNSTVLITGAKGFIGKHLLNRLQNKPGFKLKTFDINDGDVATHEFSFDTLDHIIHLAGKTYVPLSWEDPYSFYKTNYLGTLNILEQCRKYNASLTYISAYVYGTPEYLPIDENHPLKAANPYMDSKIATESLCRFYAENYNIPITIIRPFNVFGPGQSDIFLIPKIIKQVLSDSPEISVFSLDPKRDFVYVDDLVDAIIRTIDKKFTFEILNVGSGVSYSVEAIINACLKIANVQKPILCEHNERKNEINDVFANVEKAKKLLNWFPTTSFEEGLKMIIDNEKM